MENRTYDLPTCGAVPQPTARQVEFLKKNGIFNNLLNQTI
jgi:hypothetical protein